MTTRRTLLQSGAIPLLTGWNLGSGMGQAWGQTPPPPAALPLPPPQWAAELPEAQWSGTARMRFFGFDIYDATLWVAPGFRASAFAQHAFGLELAYLRALSGVAIAQRSLDEMRKTQEIAPVQAQRWLAAMQEAFADVKAGDRLAGLHTPLQGARFWLNGQPRAAINDTEFSRRFFGIWLAESTSEPALRRSLLSRAAP